MTIELLKRLVDSGNIKWSAHCLEKMGERDISMDEVRIAFVCGEIIEDYPDAFPNPSCLIYVKISESRIIHVVAGSDGEVAYMVTAYVPNTEKFEEDLKTRRK